MAVSKYTILKYYIDKLKTIENNALSINETTDIQLNQFKKKHSWFSWCIFI